MKQLGFVFIIIGLILPLIQCTPKKEAAKKSIFDYTTEELDQMSDSVFLQLLKPDSTLEYKRDTSIRLLLYPKKITVESMNDPFNVFLEITNKTNKRIRLRELGFETYCLQGKKGTHGYPHSTSDTGGCRHGHFLPRDVEEKFTLKTGKPHIEKFPFKLNYFCWGVYGDEQPDTTQNIQLYIFFMDKICHSDTITIEIKKKDSSN